LSVLRAFGRRRPCKGGGGKEAEIDQGGSTEQERQYMRRAFGGLASLKDIAPESNEILVAQRQMNVVTEDT